MRKILCVLLTFIMMLSCALVSYSAPTDDEQIFFELSSMGIIDADADMASPVSRGEFSQMVIHLLGLGSIANVPAGDCPFTDVAKDAPYAASVAMLARMGILNGYSDTIFAPDEPVTIEQAVKVAVVCTGYDSFASEKGGWPSGYIAVGASIGLLENVNVSSESDRTEIYKVLYNALDVELLEIKIGSGDMVKSNTTLRDNFKNAVNDDLYHLKGVVNANSFSYITSPVADLSADEVVIDDVIYKTGNTNVSDLVGHYVDFFAYEEGGRYVLKSIRADYDEKVISISAEDVISKSGSSLRYYDGDKEKRINLSDSVKIAYNGIRVQYPADSMWLGDVGTVTLIDHDGNGTAEVALIDRYESYIAKKYKDGLFIFNDSTKYNGKNSLYLDPDNDALQYTVTDSEGKEVSEFNENKVVSVFADLGNSRYRFAVSDLKIQGSVDEIRDDGWRIGENTYKLDKSVNPTADIGKNYEIYLNFNNEIVFVSEKTDDTYGYVLDTASSGIFSNAKVRILKAGDVDFGVDVNADDVDDTNKVPFLIAKNEAVAEFKFAEKVSINGSSCKGDLIISASSALKNTAVRYELNEKGEITSLNSLTNYAGNSSQALKYNVYEMVFGGKEETIARGFAINSDTKVICVPNGSYSEDDAMSVVKVDVNNNDVGYKVAGYEMDEITKRAKLLVMHADMNADQVRPVSIDSSRTAIVSSVREKYDAELDDVKTVVEVLQDGELKTYDSIEITNANSTIGTLSAGDVVNFIVNPDGKLENVLLICRASDFSGAFRRVSNAGGYEESFGIVGNIVSDEVDSLNYIMVSVLDVNIGGVTYTYNVPQRNKPPVYVYYKNSKQVEAASVNDIIPGGDSAYVIKKNGTNTIKAVVIVR